MTETRTIAITVHRDPSGQPTCSQTVGQDCTFLLFSHYGTQPICGFGHQQMLERGDPDGRGYIQPREGCPVWGKEARHG